MSEDQSTTPSPDFTVRFERQSRDNRDSDPHEVPAALLSQVLTGLQRVFYLLAMEKEDIRVRQRERVPGHIEQKYVLLCSPPTPGSVVVETRLGSLAQSQQAMIYDPGGDWTDIVAVADRFRHVSQELETGDISRFDRLMPDRVRSSRLLEAFRGMMPKAGSAYDIYISRSKTDSAGKTERILTLDKQFRSTFLAYDRRYDEQYGFQTLTGQLSQINFDEHKLTMFYPVTRRELECVYDEAVEETLFNLRRERIQVTGRVILDENDYPKKVIDVEDIRELDLSPFTLSAFAGENGLRLAFRQPLTLEPSMDESEQLITLEYPALGIDVFAPTREEVEDELRSNILMLWQEYAQEADDRLSPKAQRLKISLLGAIEEVPIAA